MESEQTQVKPLTITTHTTRIGCVLKLLTPNPFIWNLLTHTLTKKLSHLKRTITRIGCVLTLLTTNPSIWNAAPFGTKFACQILSVTSHWLITFRSVSLFPTFSPSVKIKNNLFRQSLYAKHTRTYHNMCNPNQRSMHDGKFVWQNYKSYKP